MRNNFFTELGNDVSTAVTAEEAIVTAGLDWEVLSQQHVVQVTVPNTEEGHEGEQSALLKPVPNSYIKFRGDTKDVLGFTGDRYNIIQNKKSFSIMDDIASSTTAKYVSAGMQGVGARVFIVAQMPGDLQIVGTNDKIEKYLMLTASHNGKSSLIMGFTPVHYSSRAVLSVARKGLVDKVSVRHTSTSERRISEAVRILKMADNYFTELENVFTGLSKVPFTSDMMDKVLDDILPFSSDEAKGKTRNENNRAKLQSFYNNSDNIAPEIKGTAWAAFLACCEYSDFGKTFTAKTGKSTVAENRFKSISEGTSYDFKNEAFETIVSLAGV